MRASSRRHCRRWEPVRTMNLEMWYAMDALRAASVRCPSPPQSSAAPRPPSSWLWPDAPPKPREAGEGWAEGVAPPSASSRPPPRPGCATMMPPPTAARVVRWHRLWRHHHGRHQARTTNPLCRPFYDEDGVLFLPGVDEGAEYYCVCAVRDRYVLLSFSALAEDDRDDEDARVQTTPEELDAPPWGVFLSVWR